MFQSIRLTIFQEKSRSCITCITVQATNKKKNLWGWGSRSPPPMRIRVKESMSFKGPRGPHMIHWVTYARTYFQESHPTRTSSTKMSEMVQVKLLQFSYSLSKTLKLADFLFQADIFSHLDFRKAFSKFRHQHYLLFQISFRRLNPDQDCQNKNYPKYTIISHGPHNFTCKSIFGAGRIP